MFPGILLSPPFRIPNCNEPPLVLNNYCMEDFLGLLKQEISYGVVYYSYEKLNDILSITMNNE